MKKLLFLGFLFLFLATANTAMAIPYTGADIEILGNGFSDISGTNYDVDNTWKILDASNSIYTAWANGNWVEYTTTLDAGNYNIGLNAINRSSLGLSDTYLYFRVGTEWESESFELWIPASDDEVNYAYFNYNIFTTGEYTITYTWLNDNYSAGNYDANIEIRSAFFDKVAPVPEPATMLLLGSGLVGLAGFKRKFKKA